MRQMSIDFEPDVVVQFPEFRDCVRASVYSCGRQLKAIAADLDMTPSELSRKLSDSTDVNFPVDRLPDLMQATGDKRPLYWLIESFMESPSAKKRRVIEEAADLVKRLHSLLETAGIDEKPELRVAK